MSRKRLFGRKLDSCYIGIKCFKIVLKRSIMAHKRIKRINGGYKGSLKEYRESVLSYWKKYGVRPRRYWYTMYCNGRSSYDPRFITDTMWYWDILPYFNNLILRRAYTDKNTLDKVLKNVRMPVCVIKSIAGYFYDKDGNLISREEAERICMQEDRLIFKPAADSSGGKNIQFFEKNEMQSSVITKYFDEYKNNFVVQRIVSQHADLAKIHKDSLNTIRVMTLHFKGKFIVLSNQLRMGSGNAKVDNFTAGGCACDIKPDGWLAEKSINRNLEWTDSHPSGLKFKDIKVPNYPAVIAKAEELHRQLPYFNLIGWDFAVDADGEPVLVEYNIMPEPNQLASGPTFGDLTEEVLQEVYIDKTLKDAFL